MYGHRFLGIFSKKHRVQADEAQALLLADAASREHDDESDVSADAR